MKIKRRVELNTVLSLLFVVGTAAVLLLGALRALVAPKDINYMRRIVHNIGHKLDRDFGVVYLQKEL